MLYMQVVKRVNPKSSHHKRNKFFPISLILYLYEIMDVHWTYDNHFIIKLMYVNQIIMLGTSLMVQWLRIHLSMQGKWVPSLVQEDPTCCGATKPLHHNYWAHVPQLLKPMRLEPVLHNKRSHHNEKSVHCNEEPLLATTRENLRTAIKTKNNKKK